MSYNSYYYLTIATIKKGNMDLYKETLVEIFGSELSWKEVKDLDRDSQRELVIKLENKIKIKKSPFDIKKLARVIQNSRSGIGGSAMTIFTCAFCGTEEMWSNTAVPRICKECATKMAEKIVLYEMDIMK